MRISKVLAIVTAAGFIAWTPVRADSNSGQSGWNVSSPDRAIQVDVAPRGERNNLQYRVRRGDVVAIDRSPLGLRYGDIDFGPNLRVVSETVEPYADDYELAHGKASKVAVRANRLALETTGTAGAHMRILFHAQNDGAAFRYEIPKQKGLPASATIAEVWYVAALNGEEQTRTVTFRPADLGITGNAQLVLAKDGTDRGNNFGVDQRTVSADTPITVDMRFMGGFLARLRAP